MVYLGISWYYMKTTGQGGYMETKMVVIKGFPVHLDRMAKVQAALEGISFKALVIKALEKYIDSESWDAKIRKAFTEDKGEIERLIKEGARKK
jgi:hypothetical protein